jgi:hypothetical protein
MEPTLVYAHNLLLRKGSHFRVYVRWIRGRMLSTSSDRNPSFDDPNSFVLEIDKGLIDVKLADIADYLNHDASNKAPLKNIKISSEDGQVQLMGTVHKVISLPFRLDGTLTPLLDVCQRSPICPCRFRYRSCLARNGNYRAGCPEHQ